MSAPTALTRWHGVALAAALLPGCRSAADEACIAQFQSAQATVLEVQSEQVDSVERSLAAVEAALRACREAGRSSEADELVKAQRTLDAHRRLLANRAELLSRRQELSKEALAELVRAGDAECPRGQAYLHRKSGQRIRCVGPQPIDMSAAEAEAFFKRRGYKQLPPSSPAELRFEYGAELVVFVYADRARAPRCAVIYPPPDISWQEATTRLTGAAPARLTPGGSLQSKSGKLALSVEEGKDKLIVRVGECAS